MLKIYTDLTDITWLTYITDEFKRISSAKFSIQISQIDENRDDDHAIYYTSDPQHQPNIVNKSTIPHGELVEISAGLFVFQNTLIESDNYLLPYDIFRNAFLILSRYEEYQHELKGEKIRSYSSRHPRKDKSSFWLPLVNIYFQKLEEIINGLYPDLEFGQEKNFKLDLSHDVDYLKKTTQLILKQTAFNTYNLLKSLGSPKRFISRLKATISFPFISHQYRCFDYWKDVELGKGQNSIFYVYVKTRGRSLKEWLIDPSYNLKSNPVLQNKLAELNAAGFEVGLHGSLKSAVNIDMLKEEKEGLERVLSRPVTRVRQHWLNYSESKTPSYHNELFAVDSTLGWNDRMGFRSGCASKYRPWDHANNKAFDYFVIPQVLMDSNIFDYSNIEDAKEKAISMLQGMKKFKNVNASISWHYRTCSNDYKWHKVYEEILDECL